MVVTDADIEIDFERVVSDPAYRRRVVEVLNRRESLLPAPFEGSRGNAHDNAHDSGAGVELGTPE